MKKKIDQLKELMLSERWDEALSLASKFEDLGEHAREIRMAHGANTSPSMYQQMGHDLSRLRKIGISALMMRYRRFYLEDRMHSEEGLLSIRK